MTFNDTVELAADILVDTTNDRTSSSGGSVLFADVVFSEGPVGNGLSVEAGDGSVRFVGAVLGISELSVAGGLIETAEVSTLGGQSYSGLTTLDGDLVTEGTSVTFNGEVMLSTDVLIDLTDGGAIPLGANLTVNGTVDSGEGHGLTIDVGGGVSQLNGPVSGLDRLVVSGGLIELADVTTANEQAYSGDLRLGGDLITSASPVTLDGDVVLTDAAVLVDSTNLGAIAGGADVSFSGSIEALPSGDQGLTIQAGDGLVRLAGPVSGLREIAASGGAIETGAIEVQENIGFSGRSIDFTGGANSIRTSGGW